MRCSRQSIVFRASVDLPDEEHDYTARLVPRCRDGGHRMEWIEVSQEPSDSVPRPRNVRVAGDTLRIETKA
jgi:hypothetical protein